jgi:hypothetical protein
VDLFLPPRTSPSSSRPRHEAVEYARSRSPESQPETELARAPSMAAAAPCCAADEEGSSPLLMEEQRMQAMPWIELSSGPWCWIWLIN